MISGQWRVVVLTAAVAALVTGGAVTVAAGKPVGWVAVVLAGLVAGGREILDWLRKLLVPPAGGERPSPTAAVATRVRDAGPLSFGIRATTRTKHGPHAILPTYVPRDIDKPLQEALRAAEARGGFILLVGHVAAGKRYTAYTALRAVVGDWRLYTPASLAELGSQLADPRQLRRTVVWLDDLPTFLGNRDGTEPQLLIRLVTMREPIIVMATVWPKTYSRLSLEPEVGAIDHDHAVRRVIRAAELFDVDDRLSEAETSAAWQIADTDPRISEALRDDRVGMTQSLSLAPQLMLRWRLSDAYAYAVLTAAIDANRIGIAQPLDAALLRDAATGYLTEAEERHRPPDWFETAVAWLTEPLQNDLAPLQPTGGGYLVAGYLRQEVAALRDRKAPPRSLWAACAKRVRRPADLFAAGRSAYERDFDSMAIRIWLQGCRLGDVQCAESLVGLLTDLGRHAFAEAILRHMIGAGHTAARPMLADLLARKSDLEGVEQVWRAGLDDHQYLAYQQLAYALLRRRAADVTTVPHEAAAVLRDAIAAGFPDAYVDLASLVLRDGDHAVAEELLRTALGHGHRGARPPLAALLASDGRDDDAIELLIAAVADRDAEARVQLAELYLRAGDAPRAEALLRDGVRLDEAPARWRLARLLTEDDRAAEADAVLADGARQRDHRSRQMLIDALFSRLDPNLRRQPEFAAILERLEILCRDGIRQGDPQARVRLADLLVIQSRTDLADEMWRKAVKDGEPLASVQYAQWLMEAGRETEAVGVLTKARVAGDTRAREMLDSLHDRRSVGREPASAYRPYRHGLTPPQRDPR